MKRIIPGLACLFLLLGAARAAEMSERWVYVSTNLAYDNSVEALISMMREAKPAGVTHIQLNDYQTGYLADLPPRYFANVRRVKAAAEELGLVVVPGVFGVGSSGRYLHNDPNLADGIPVKDMRFVVKGGVATADPAETPDIANGGFDTSEAGAPAGWQVVVDEGGEVALDASTFHSGSSLRVRNAGGRDAGRCGVAQTVKVKPFHTYRLSLWMKTEGLRPERFPVMVVGSRDKRQLCFSYFMQDTRQNWPTSQDVVVADGSVDFGPQPTLGWREFKVAFNSLDYDEIDLFAGLGRANTGTIWFDDIRLEPTGLLNVLRRDLTPVVVTSADGKTVYRECVDYKRIEDPQLGCAPSRGDFMLSARGTFEIWHEAPPIVLTADSRIKDGETLLVSFYSPGIIYVKQQVTLSVSDPAAFAPLEDEFRRVSALWQSRCYFLNYDEIRSGGWEPQPGGATLTPGQLLARHVAKAVETCHRYAPGAKLYIWSDMFDPFHNARKLEAGQHYYLVNGSWAGSWEGLPAEVGILNWNGGKARDSLKWFADRGHRQIFAGYYDATSDEAVDRGIDSWLDAADDMPGVVGAEYTTWTGNYDFLGEFFRHLVARGEGAAASGS